ncbi:MAG TPA: MarR family transcriptional regulator [Gemmatimonadaceae bacterium]|jgi:DNA-binding MarR family transcriptional regulator
MTTRHTAKAALIPALIADVFELAGALQTSSDALAAVAGQTGARWQVLWVADEAPRTVPDIARRLGRTRQAVQRLADLLVADGLAAWQDNPAHRRSPYVGLTNDGRHALAAIMRVSDEWRSEVGTGFTVAELTTMRDAIQRLSARITSVSI